MGNRETVPGGKFGSALKSAIVSVLDKSLIWWAGVSRSWEKRGEIKENPGRIKNVSLPVKKSERQRILKSYEIGKNVSQTVSLHAFPVWLSVNMTEEKEFHVNIGVFFSFLTFRPSLSEIYANKSAFSPTKTSEWQAFWRLRMKAENFTK